MSHVLCLWHLFSAHLARARKRAEEWADVPVVANTYRSQAAKIQHELDGLRCSCERPQVVREDEIC